MELEVLKYSITLVGIVTAIFSIVATFILPKDLPT